MRFNSYRRLFGIDTHFVMEIDTLAVVNHIRFATYNTGRHLFSYNLTNYSYMWAPVFYATGREL